MKNSVENVFKHEASVSRELRQARMKQRGATLWLTGLSGSGKSTIAHALEHALIDRGVVAYVLDGDNIRLGLNRDLDFSEAGRSENIRRIGEVARLFTDANVMTITAFISPYRADRDRVRSLHAPGDFIEIHVDCPLEVCEARDTKGLYAKARRGDVSDFTGISAPYEPPLNAEIVLRTSESDLDSSVAAIIRWLEEHDHIPRS